MESEPGEFQRLVATATGEEGRLNISSERRRPPDPPEGSSLDVDDLLTRSSGPELPVTPGVELAFS